MPHMVPKVHLLSSTPRKVLTLASPIAKFLALISLLAFVCLGSVFASTPEDWQPIVPEELKMTAEPLAPGAPAVYLYRQVDRDDQNGHGTGDDWRDARGSVTASRNSSLSERLPIGRS